jgi:hypothetical protein
MRTLIFSIAILLISCQSTTKNLGEQFTPKAPLSVDALLAEVQTSGGVKDVQVQGKVEKSCMSEGCWFTIRDASGKEVLFNVKDKKFKVPVNSPGQTVIVLADAARDTSSEQKTELLVRGMRFP